MNEKKHAEELQALLVLAEKTLRTNPKLSRTAVKDAFRFSQRLRIRIPREQKRWLCKYCFTLLKPGASCTVRNAKGRVIITCLHCKNVKRLQYRK